MKKRMIIALTLLFVLMQAMPAWASYNLNINGKSYAPANSPQIEQGTTMVPLDLIARVLGAEVSVSGQTITIKKGANTLIMTVGSNLATFNGSSISLPNQPSIINGNAMVPMRFIYEKFGAKVDWLGESQTIAVKYSEKRQGLSVDEMLAKSNEAMAKLNTYKMKIAMNMDVKMADSKGKNETMKMDSQMDFATQQKPILMYGKMIAQVVAPQGQAAGNVPVETEMLFNENGMYMTMPGQGWVKYNTPGLDMKALLEQSGSEDPLNSLKQMKDYGVILTYADDKQKNGKNYWVIKVTMGAESFNKIMGDTMKKIPLAGNDSNTQDGSAEAGKIMTELLKNMQADIIYDVWIDQSNYQMAYMDLDANLKFKMQIPADEENSNPISVTMDMKEKADYEIYDLGLTFSVPDVSQAIDFEQYMESQMQEEV